MDWQKQKQKNKKLKANNDEQFHIEHEINNQRIKRLAATYIQTE